MGWKKFAETEKGMAGQVFFDIKGVVHHEFLCKGQTVDHWYYLEVLKHLRENVSRERPQLEKQLLVPRTMTMHQLMHRY
jgi:hypothetical protein